MGGLTESFPDYYEVRRRAAWRGAPGARALARSRVSSLSTSREIQVLGIPRGATDAEIKRSYRKLAVRWHPRMTAQSPK